MPVQVKGAVKLLVEMGAIGSGAHSPAVAQSPVDGMLPRTGASAERPCRQLSTPVVAVVVEPGRPQLAREMLGTAAGLATAMCGSVTAIASEPLAPDRAGSWGADEVLQLTGAAGQEDVACAIGKWSEVASPWAILAPGTIWGREVAARVAVILQAGLTGDAVELGVGGQG